MKRRAAVTCVCVVLFLVGARLPFPTLDAEALFEVSDVMGISSPRLSLFTLGVVPFLTAFVLIELFSLLTKPGRRLRRQGVEGRRKLNRAALLASVLVVGIQAKGISLWWSGLTSPSGATVTTAPSWFLMITLSAATFVVAGLAEAISRYGLGNGFAVLFVASLIPSVFSTIRHLAVGAPYGEPGTNIMGLVWVALFTAFVVAFMRYRPEVRLTTSEGMSLPYRMPPLPQGIAPLSWAYAVVHLLTGPVTLSATPILQLDPIPYFGLLAVVILALSPLAGWMFTAHKRLETNLEGAATVDAEPYDRLWTRGLILGALVLAGGGAGVAALPELLPAVDTAVLPLLTLLPLVAVALDLVDEARLVAKGKLERILTLDNVHLAELLRARLAEEGIESVVTCFRYRRLSYFLGPLFKMGLLVPAADRERAEQLVEETPFQIV